MNKDTTYKMTVVKKYHSLIDKKGCATFGCVGFLFVQFSLLILRGN